MVNRAASHHDSDPTTARQQPDSRMPAGVRRWPAENPVAGAGIDPAENHQPCGDNRHDKNDKSDQCGRWVRINPVSIGLNAAPATPATGRRSSWPSSPAGQYGQSAYTPRGINHFPEGEDRRRDPHAHRLAPENIKPTRPITKQTVPKVISGRIFSRSAAGQPRTAEQPPPRR